METDLISVIIPVYNVEKYLDKCINSVVNQTYKNLEIILVDDGSTDNSSRICDDWAEKDNRIKVIHKENGGVSSARNAALKIISGKYFAFIDGDDYIDRDMYSALYACAASTDFDIVFCGMCGVDEEDNVLYTQPMNYDEIYDNQILIKFFNGEFLFSIWNKLYKTEILASNILFFNEELGYGEDYIFNYHYIKHSKSAAAIDGIYYKYLRNRTDSATYSFSTGFFNCWKNTKTVMNNESDNQETCSMLLTQYTNDLLTVAKNICTRKDGNKYTDYYFEIADEIKNNYSLIMSAENIAKIKRLVLRAIRLNPVLTKMIISLIYKLKALVGGNR